MGWSENAVAVRNETERNDDVAVQNSKHGSILVSSIRASIFTTIVETNARFFTIFLIWMGAVKWKNFDIWFDLWKQLAESIDCQLVVSCLKSQIVMIYFGSVRHQ